MLIFIQAELLYHYILTQTVSLFLYPCILTNKMKPPILVPSLRWHPLILVPPGCIPADELKFVMNHLPGKVELHCYQSSHQHCQCSSSVVIVILSSMMPHSQEGWIFWSIPRDMINDERMSIVHTPPKLGTYWEINPLIRWLVKTVSGRVYMPKFKPL